MVICVLVSLAGTLDRPVAQEQKTPIVVNGDVVEYSTDKKEVTAAGNVEVTYKGSKLTCDKLTVNTETKDGVASGNVELQDNRGVVKAEEMQYNFETQTGRMINARIGSTPYYGEGDDIIRVSENRFDIKNGYMTTCNFDRPHFKIASRLINFLRGDKIKSKNDLVYLGGVPILYLPQYTHSLKDPLMHVQLMPGHKKVWGSYMLSAWRYKLTDNIGGRIYFDYRQQLGLAEGFGLNYNSQNFGNGDYKFYYTQERPGKTDEGAPSEFERYLVRWRHMWNINPTTKATLEYYKIGDAKRKVLGSGYNFLKDYFEREYEKDEQPKSYVLVNHLFPYASLNFLIQKHINNWFTETEKLPEVLFSMPGFKLGETPLYLNNEMKFSNLNSKNAVPSDSTADVSVTRFDTYNKLFLPTRLLFIQASPYVGARETFYNKDINGSSLWGSPRTVFYSGIEMSTKFYRLFNVSSHFLGMDINDFRHIITPTVKYAYTHEPTITSAKLKQLDDIDSIVRSNKVTLELENKLQTKDSDKKTIDFATFRVTTDYNYKPKGGTGSSFSDFLFDLELIPYAWLRVDSDATYDHRGDNFKTINFDLYANLGEERSFGIGQRYERKGGKELTSELRWRLNPKWRYRVYEQEYTITRDLHCWEADLTYNVKRGEGETIWLVFRLKAFPKMEFSLDQSYHQPKAGSQGL
jgi:lipopolysaccharide assembly outer membrane protein LptD (OstA)